MDKFLTIHILASICTYVFATKEFLTDKNTSYKLNTDFPPRLYSLNVSSIENLKFLQKLYQDEEKHLLLDFWSPPIFGKMTDILITTEEQESSLLKYFQDANFNVEQLLVRNVQNLISESKSNRFRSANEMTWTEYHHPDKIFTWMTNLNAMHPQITQLYNLGNSSEGNPMMLMKISKFPNRKAVFIDATTHSREWITTAVATYIINELILNADESELLKNYDFYIIPIVNVDGYIHTHEVNRLWRKSRRDTTQSKIGNFFGCRGVDLNRNFGHEWGGRGSGAIPCSFIYRGSHAFSEPETRAIRDFVLNKEKGNVDWAAYFSLHAYGQKWLTPWAYTKDKPKDYDEMYRIASIGTVAIKDVYGTEYEIGNSASLLYYAAGGSDDWFKGELGCKYAFTLELRDRGYYGFLLPSQQIIPTAIETWAGISAALSAISIQ